MFRKGGSTILIGLCPNFWILGDSVPDSTILSNPKPPFGVGVMRGAHQGMKRTHREGYIRVLDQSPNYFHLREISPHPVSPRASAGYEPAPFELKTIPARFQTPNGLICSRNRKSKGAGSASGSP
jgi:hypothetical protein